MSSSTSDTGQMADLISRFDWATTPLGPIERWPQSLKTAVDLMLGSGHAMQLAWGPERTVLYNDAYTPMLGGHHPAALGLPFREAWPDIWDDIAPLVAQVFAGETIRFENMPLIMKRSGYSEETWWNFSYSPVRDESGEVAGLLNVTVDATPKMHALRAERERDEANARVRQSEERLRALVNASSDVVYTMSPDWTQMRQLDGRGFVDDTSAPSVNWMESYLFPEDRDAVTEVAREAVATQGIFQMEHRVRRAGGGTGWTLSRAVPVLGREGEIIEWFGMAADTTAQHDADMLQSFLLRLSDALRVASDEHEIAQIALPLIAGELMLDRCYIAHMDVPTDRSELVHEVRRPDLPPVPAVLRMSDFPAVLSQAMQHTLVFNDVATDARLGARDRESFDALRFGALLAAPLRLGEGLLIWCLAAVSQAPRVWRPGEIALIEQASERIWAAIVRTRSEKALRDADRKKDEFLAMLAHELRNPIATIRNASYVLTQDPGHEMAARSSAAIERQVLVLGKLVDDLLDVSRITRGLVTLNRVPCDLQDIVRNAVSNLHSMVEEKGQDLELTLSARPLRVLGDATRLEQIVVNLVANAVKYTDAGGRIEVRVGMKGDNAWLSVRDNGIGMTADFTSRVFDLFAQAEHGLARSKGGLGVGLTIVRQLVDLHGGTITARSDGLGQGSEFVVTWPLIDADARAAGGSAARGGAEEGVRGRRILVVDDRPDYAASLADLLRLNGHDVRTEDSGVRSLDRVGEWHPDVVLLDIGLPDMDGYEVARRMRDAHGSHLRLAAISGYGKPDDVVQARAAGFDRHFIKPVDVEALLGWVGLEAVKG